MREEFQRMQEEAGLSFQESLPVVELLRLSPAIRSRVVREMIFTLLMKASRQFIFQQAVVAIS